MPKRVYLIIPVYNEEKIIKETIDSINLAFSSVKNFVIDIFIASNASTDNTVSIAETASKNCKNLHIFKFDKKGKGLAILETAKKISDHSFDYFLFMDADLSVSAEQVIDFLSEIDRSNCDMLIGSRFHEKSIVQRSAPRGMTSLVFSTLSHKFLTDKIRDFQCGIKVMNRKGFNCLSECDETGWFLDSELVSIAIKRGLKVKEMPIKWQEYNYPERRTKLKVIKESIYGIFALIRIKRKLKKMV